MKNLFFISGPQGAGKTTLLEKISGPDIIFPDVQLIRSKFDTSPEFRIQLKICQRAIENFCYYNIANQNPEKTVIGNRCIYDQLVFDEVYVKLGWITEDYRKKLDESSQLFYHPNLINPNVIILNPGFDVVKRHLEERWIKKGKKWKEDNEEYVRLACEGYEKYKDKDNVLYIDHEINLERKEEFESTIEWLRKMARFK